jgi:hypothetical protein
VKLARWIFGVILLSIGILTPGVSSAMGPGVLLPSAELNPVCRTSGNRIVVVYSHRPSSQYSVPTATLRSIVKRTNWKIADQSSQSSAGKRVVRMAVDCNAEGLINVYDVATTYNKFSNLASEVSNALFKYPSGENAVKYLIFDQSANEEFPNRSGQANGGSDVKKSHANGFAVSTMSAATYYYNSLQWETHVPMHELFHAMGATQSSAPDAYEAHVTDGWDIMSSSPAESPCYEYLGYSTPNNVPIDCDKDTYFNAAPKPGTWLANNWNLADRENWFLVAPPKASTEVASSVKVGSAVLNGTADPQGTKTHYYFEYGLTSGYGNVTSGETDDEGPVKLETFIPKLKIGTTYHFRIVAVNRDGDTVKGEDKVFTTSAPTITPEVTTNIGKTEATLNTSVNPNGFATTYRFEYGKTTSYGTSVPVPNESVGSGTEAVAKTKTITGLSPETTYHFRVVAETSEGTAYGPDQSLTTLAIAPKSLYQFGGGLGTGNNQFEAPEGIAVDSSGNVWVSDRSHNRIQKFTEKGEYLLQFGTEGSGNGQFEDPRGMVATGSGDLWVVDSGNARIQRFNSKGEYVGQFGTFGGGNGQFGYPVDIAIAPDGSIWVSDTGYDNVQKFTSSGAFLLKSGSLGSGDGQFSNPQGIAADSAGNVWIADTGNNRMQKLSAGGVFLSKFGSKGSGNGQFEEPVDVVVKPSGNLLVAEDAEPNHRVQQLAPDGQWLATISEWSPLQIALGRGGKFFIPMGSHRQVQVWSQPAKPEATTEPATSLKTTEATLNGVVNPSGASATYRFEYGKTTSYGTSVPAPYESVGSGTEAIAKTKTITGLSPETTYHFRVVAENSEGTAYGADRTFVPATASALGSLTVVEPFDGGEVSLANFASNWSVLGWVAGNGKGGDTSTGWRPVASYPTVNGAFYAATVSDIGTGLASGATLAASPSGVGRYFSVWLDMPTPAGARAGYELRFTYLSTDLYDVSLSKWIEGAQSVLASQSSYAFASGSSLALVDRGSTVSVWIDMGAGFSQLLSASDATFAGGKAAIEGAGNITRLTNFRLGTL